MKEIGKKGTDAKRKAGFVPVCPDCGTPMTRTILELDDGEPGLFWQCSCTPTEEDLEEELAEDDDDYPEWL